ncbi:MAG: tRNA glutamyl-Q(34) synthetase GluQRS [Planctomycetota bacterium JB042]
MLPFRTRLAPSPTGFLHLGNARTFLVNWWMARAAGGTVVLRIEDLDRARVKEGFVERQIEDLRWLGLDWDEGPILQSSRLERYAAAFERLRRLGLAYPCVCSRREIRAAAGAPHAEDEGPTYPGTCRGRFPDEEAAREARGATPAWRFVTPDEEFRFEDRVRGEIRARPARAGGDFVLRTVEGIWSYQLAVAVDDAASGITEVVRGDDLVPSTPRQLALLRALELPAPRYAHLPLVLDASGARLAKRRGDTELATLRERGVDPEEVVAFLARHSGLDDAGTRLTAAAGVGRFSLDRLPRSPVSLRSLPWSA